MQVRSRFRASSCLQASSTSTIKFVACRDAGVLGHLLVAHTPCGVKTQESLPSRIPG